MSEQDIANIIRLVRRAPLQNMDEAEFVAALLQRFARHFLPPEKPAEGEVE